MIRKLTELQDAAVCSTAASTHEEERSAAMLATHCVACGFNNFPASTVCASCWDENVSTIPLSKNGRLYSFSSIAFNGAKTYVGYVDFPEGVRAFVGLHGFDENHPPACDLLVTLRETRYVDPGPKYVFEPHQASEQS